MSKYSAIHRGGISIPEESLDLGESDIMDCSWYAAPIRPKNTIDPVVKSRSKYRIVFDGKYYLIQKRVWIFWRKVTIESSGTIHLNFLNEHEAEKMLQESMISDRVIMDKKVKKIKTYYDEIGNRIK